MTPNEARSFAQAGINALQSNNPKTAVSYFEKITSAGFADASIYLALAYAHLALDNREQVNRALDELLVREPYNLRGLILKAENFSALGDDKAALSYYQSVLKHVPTKEKITPEIQADVDYANRMCVQLAKKFEDFTVNNLGGELPLKTENAKRFKDSLDLLFGKTQLYFQNPRLYYFPGLPQIQFYDRKLFPWFDQLEAATADIRAELQVILAEDSAFHPYVEADKNRAISKPSPMLNNPAWSAFYLWKNGQEVKENVARCPKTMAALAAVPLTNMPNRSPSILFSLLRPGAKIPPHTGVLNTRLICHLPLIIPPKCGLRVGNETREWEVGKGWLFDDTIEHEAWNLSDQNRVILIFEVWRPELTLEERALVSKLMETINAYHGAENGGDAVWDM